MVWTGPLLPVDERGRSVYVCPDLTAEDVAWLNTHIDLAGQPVRYALRQPRPPAWERVQV
jgi:hypothetical protein